MHCCSLKHASSLFSKILTTEVLNSSRHFLVEWNESCVKASLIKPDLFEGSRKVISIPSPLHPTGSLAWTCGGHWTREDQQHVGSGAQIEVQAWGSDEARPKEGKTASGTLPGWLPWDCQAGVASPQPCTGSGLRLQSDLWGNVKGELLPRSAFLFTILRCYWR